MVVNLAQGMTERGLPVDLVAAAAEGPLVDQVPATARLVDLKSKRVLRSLSPLIGYLRRERPRVVVSSMGHANLVALWAARLAPGATPVVVTVHNTMSQSTPQQGLAAETLAASPADVLSVGLGGRGGLPGRGRRPGPDIRPAARAGSGGLQSGDHARRCWRRRGGAPITRGSRAASRRSSSASGASPGRRTSRRSSVRSRRCGGDGLFG